MRPAQLGNSNRDSVAFKANYAANFGHILARGNSGKSEAAPGKDGEAKTAGQAAVRRRGCAGAPGRDYATRPDIEGRDLHI